MSTATYKCDTCGIEFHMQVSAEECEREHVREKLKRIIVDNHGPAVWRCLCEIEKWVGQPNWQDMAADELVEFRKGNFDEPGDANAT